MGSMGRWPIGTETQFSGSSSFIITGMTFCFLFQLRPDCITRDPNQKCRPIYIQLLRKLKCKFQFYVHIRDVLLHKQRIEKPCCSIRRVNLNSMTGRGCTAAAGYRKDLRIICAYNVLRNTLYEKEDGNTYGAVVVVVVVVPININAVFAGEKRQVYTRYSCCAIREKRDESFFPPFEKRYVYISQRSLYLYIVALLDFFLLLFSSTSIYPHHPFFFSVHIQAIQQQQPHTHTQKKEKR